MKILHTINSLTIGGAEMLLLNAIKAFKKYCPEHEHFIVTVMNGGPLSDEIPAYCTYEHLGGGPMQIPLLAKSLKKLIQKWNIDIVHSHLYEAMITSRLACSKKTMHVSTYHTGFHNKKSIEYSKKRLWADKATYNGHDVIFVSDAIRKDIVGAISSMNKHAKTVPNFVDNRFIHLGYTLNDGPLKLISVGNLRAQKHHALAIKGMALCKDLEIELDIYGAGEMEQELQQLIDKTSACVNLKGAQHITSELLAAYDAFLMTSFHEGMPISLIEAITTGLPSILNNIPELRETAMDTAIYFGKNSVEDLSAKLREVCENKSILQNLADKTQAQATRYQPANYVSSMLKIYKHE